MAHTLRLSGGGRSVRYGSIQPVAGEHGGDEQPLPGGNVSGAIRIGDTVRRPTGPWTPAVHALLDHLHRAGLDSIPAVLGVDEQGREILTYLPGRGIDIDTEAASDALLADAAEWLRRFHDAVRDFRPPGPVRWRNATRTLGTDEIICHHDPGAYNWIVAGERLVGVVDWDMAGPGRPIDDLAFLVWNSLPLFRPLPAPDVTRRLRVVAAAYGGVAPTTVLAHVEARMRSATDRIEAGQRHGDPGMLNLASVGEPARTRQRLSELRDRLPEIESRLAGGA